MGADDPLQMLNNQTIGFALMLLFAAIACGAALLLTRRRRYPHAPAWALFVAWAVVVNLVPAVRALDTGNPVFYGLRGVFVGLVLASMLALGRPKQEAAPAPPNGP